MILGNTKCNCCASDPGQSRSPESFRVGPKTKFSLNWIWNMTHSGEQASRIKHQERESFTWSFLIAILAFNRTKTDLDYPISMLQSIPYRNTLQLVITMAAMRWEPFFLSYSHSITRNHSLIHKRTKINKGLTKEMFDELQSILRENSL